MKHTAIFQQGERVESPDVQQRLLEAEKRVEELQALLQEVQLERYM